MFSDSYAKFGDVKKGYVVRWDEKGHVFVVVDGNHHLKLLISDHTKEYSSIEIRQQKRQEYVDQSKINVTVLASRTPKYFTTIIGQTENIVNKKVATTHIGDLILKYQHLSRNDAYEEVAMADTAIWQTENPNVTAEKVEAFFQKRLEDLASKHENVTQEKKVLAACRVCATEPSSDLVKLLPIVSRWVAGDCLKIVLQEAKKRPENWNFELKTLYWGDSKKFKTDFNDLVKSPLEFRVCFIRLLFYACRSFIWSQWQRIQHGRVQLHIGKVLLLVNSFTLWPNIVGRFGNMSIQ